MADNLEKLRQEDSAGRIARLALDLLQPAKRRK
jgi:hypothetical protein